MDQIMQYDIQLLKEYSKSHIDQKKFIKILLSLSLFSLLFSNLSLLPLLLHSLNNFISTISMELFTYNTHRNYIFLLCNGILVFLIKNSGLIANSPPDHADDHIDGHQMVPQLLEAKVAIKEQMPREAHKRREYGNLVTREDIEKWLLSSQNGDEGEGEEDEFVSVNEEEEEEEEEEEGIEMLSAEELNRKCEDFIKKMKEGIKIEAQAHSQQQLIMS